MWALHGGAAGLSNFAAERDRFAAELDKQQYYQRRNRQARNSHTKTRLAQLAALDIDVESIKSCLPDTG